MTAIIVTDILEDTCNINKENDDDDLFSPYHK